MTLEEALEKLRTLDSFKLVLEDLDRDREDAIQAAGMADDVFSSAKSSGRIETVDMILRKLSGN